MKDEYLGHGLFKKADKEPAMNPFNPPIEEAVELAQRIYSDAEGLSASEVAAAMNHALSAPDLEALQKIEQSIFKTPCDPTNGPFYAGTAPDDFAIYNSDDMICVEIVPNDLTSDAQMKADQAFVVQAMNNYRQSIRELRHVADLIQKLADARQAQNMVAIAEVCNMLEDWAVNTAPEVISE